MVKPSTYIRLSTIIVLCTEDVSANSSTENVLNLLWLLPDSRQKKLTNSQNGILYSASFVSEFPKFMKIGATVHGILFMQLINVTASCDAIDGRTEKQF